MAKRVWTFELEDGSHTVELEHGTITGERMIHLDGQPVHRSRQVADLGSEHPLEVGGRTVVVFIRTNGITFSYDLAIDGRSLETGKEVRVPAWPTALAQPDGSPPGGPVPASTGAVATAAAGQNIEDLHALMLREIHSWGRCSIMVGVLHFAASRYVSAPWGVILVLVGLASYLFPDAAMFVVYGAVLAWAAVGNVSVGQAGGIAFGVLQAFLAFRVFRQYSRFRLTQTKLTALQPEKPAYQSHGRRTALAFPWLGCLLPVVAIGGPIALVLAAIIGGYNEPPPIFLPALEVFVDLGVLGFAASLASLLSGFRYRVLAAFGVVAGGMVMLAFVVLAVLSLVG